MAKYIAEIQDASGNTVYPATQWGAITNPPTIPNMGDYYKKVEVNGLIASASKQEIKGVNGAATSAWLTVDKASKICILVINSKLPTKTGTMYWIPKEYATDSGKIPLIRCGNQATLAVYGNGNVELLNNSSDTAESMGFAVWGY